MTNAPQIGGRSGAQFDGAGRYWTYRVVGTYVYYYTNDVSMYDTKTVCIKGNRHEHQDGPWYVGVPAPIRTMVGPFHQWEEVVTAYFIEAGR